MAIRLKHADGNVLGKEPVAVELPLTEMLPHCISNPPGRYVNPLAVAENVLITGAAVNVHGAVTVPELVKVLVPVNVLEPVNVLPDASITLVVASCTGVIVDVKDTGPVKVCPPVQTFVLAMIMFADERYIEAVPMLAYFIIHATAILRGRVSEDVLGVVIEPSEDGALV